MTPEPHLATLKTRVTIETLVQSRGIALKPAGADLVALCPFHTEKTPSFTVTPAKGLYHCFGCGRGGDIFNFVMEADGVDFKEAVKRIESMAGSAQLQPSRVVEPRGRKPALRIPQQNRENPFLIPAYQQILDHVLKYYTTTLEKSIVAKEYLTSRALTHGDLITRFRMGYADGTLLTHLPDQRTAEGRNDRSVLHECGILMKKSHGTGYAERMAGRIVIPVLDEHGNMRQLYGRKLPIPDGNTDAPDHIYLPFPRDALFHVQAFRACTTLILCEGPLDALSFYCAGYPNVSCVYSAHEIPPALIPALREGTVERVIVATDDDAAGHAGAAKLIKLLAGEGIRTVRMGYPTDRMAGCSTLAEAAL
jgi:DNA primase catalytic core